MSVSSTRLCPEQHPKLNAKEVITTNINCSNDSNANQEPSTSHTATCCYCQKPFTNKRDLKKHLITTHENKQKRCYNRTCFVPKCRTGYRYNKEKKALFQVPKDPVSLRIWRKMIPRKDRELGQYDVICEKHFKDECIERFYRHVINGTIVLIPRGRPKLVDGALPTEYPELPSYSTMKLNQDTEVQEAHMKEIRDNEIMNRPSENEDGILSANIKTELVDKSLPTGQHDYQSQKSYMKKNLTSEYRGEILNTNIKSEPIEDALLTA